jgi:hypothetical protein
MRAIKLPFRIEWLPNSVRPKHADSFGMSISKSQIPERVSALKSISMASESKFF